MGCINKIRYQLTNQIMKESSSSDQQYVYIVHLNGIIRTLYVISFIVTTTLVMIYAPFTYANICTQDGFTQLLPALRNTMFWTMFWPFAIPVIFHYRHVIREWWRNMTLDDDRHYWGNRFFTSLFITVCSGLSLFVCLIAYGYDFTCLQQPTMIWLWIAASMALPLVIGGFAVIYLVAIHVGLMLSVAGKVMLPIVTKEPSLHSQRRVVLSMV